MMGETVWKTGLIRLALSAGAALLLLQFAHRTWATEEYAEMTGRACAVCHLSEEGGGGLTTAGEAYFEDPEGWRAPSEAVRPRSLTGRLLRLTALYIHIIFGVLWIGTILYVHIVLKPTYAIGGLPKTELRLAWLSMPMIAVSGTVLTVMQAGRSPGLFSTWFGMVLIAKMTVFGLMLTSAVLVTIFIGPRLRRIAESRRQGVPGGKAAGDLTADQLEAFDGREGRRTYVAEGGRIWDFSDSKPWKEGHHAGRHQAGRDLTLALADAPHGREVLEKFRQVASLTGGDAPQPAVVKAFLSMAHFNLGGCFLILLLLALLRW